MTQGAPSSLIAETIQRQSRLVGEMSLGWWNAHCYLSAVGSSVSWGSGTSWWRALYCLMWPVSSPLPLPNVPKFYWNSPNTRCEWISSGSWFKRLSSALGGCGGRTETLRGAEEQNLDHRCEAGVSTHILGRLEQPLFSVSQAVITSGSHYQYLQFTVEESEPRSFPIWSFRF